MQSFSSLAENKYSTCTNEQFRNMYSHYATSIKISRAPQGGSAYFYDDKIFLFGAFAHKPLYLIKIRQPASAAEGLGIDRGDRAGDSSALLQRIAVRQRV